eukprot:14816322-Alexandrium_andersonii.AAC.1
MAPLAVDDAPALALDVADDVGGEPSEQGLVHVGAFPTASATAYSGIAAERQEAQDAPDHTSEASVGIFDDDSRSQDNPDGDG